METRSEGRIWGVGKMMEVLQFFDNRERFGALIIFTLIVLWSVKEIVEAFRK